ncbi:MAG TPA: sugar kinase [Candidatus Nanopelagicales bacterium]|nr:sugar kinase [Candidatus Nanopelagicales bacterium]
MTEPATEFVVVGQWMTDVVAALPGPLREGTDTAAHVAVMGGGAAANTAAWLAHDGRPTILVARIGDDMLGRAGRAELEAGGVRCSLTVDPTRPSGTCIVLVAPDGERTMVPDAGANEGLRPADLDEGLFARGRHLHLSGYTLLVDGSRMAGLSALDRARLRGMTTSVDVASVGPLADAGAARFLSWVTGVDVLLANESEAALLAGLPQPQPDTDLASDRAAAEAAARVLVTTVGAVVVKLGAHGALAVTADGRTAWAEAVPVDVVDTTGAGDAFAAGFLPAWTADEPLVTALERGNRAGARVVSRVGARP